MKVIKKGKPRKIYDIKFKSSKLRDWTGNTGGKKYMWISVRYGYLYISLGVDGGKYWNMPHPEKLGDKRPKIKANDKTQVISINTYKMKFKNTKDYNFCKKRLLPYSK